VDNKGAETLSEAKEVLETLNGGMLQKTSIAGYHLFSTIVEYGGVKQRWIVVLSEKAFSRERATLEKRVEKERKKPTKRPTIRRVFQVFEGIAVLYYWLEDGEGLESKANSC
jgi:transposase